MTQNHNVSVSMNQAAAVKTGMVFKQGDFGFNLVITVLDFDVTGTTPQIVFRKPMGAVESSTITVSGNTYTYAMKGTELDTPGKVYCDLKLKNSTTQRISSASFMFEVVADTLDGLAEETSSYSDTIAQIIDGYEEELNFEKKTDETYTQGIIDISNVTQIDSGVETGMYDFNTMETYSGAKHATASVSGVTNAAILVTGRTGDVNSSVNYGLVAFLDSSDNVIYTFGKSNTEYENKLIPVPSGASTIIVNGTNSKQPKIYKFDTIPIAPLSEDIDYLINWVRKESDNINDEQYEKGGMWNGSGYVNNKLARTQNYLPVTAGKTIKAYAMYGNSNISGLLVAEYDENKAFKRQSPLYCAPRYSNQSITLGNDAAFIKFVLGDEIEGLDLNNLKISLYNSEDYVDAYTPYYVPSWQSDNLPEKGLKISNGSYIHFIKVGENNYICREFKHLFINNLLQLYKMYYGTFVNNDLVKTTNIGESYSDVVGPISICRGEVDSWLGQWSGGSHGKTINNVSYPTAEEDSLHVYVGGSEVSSDGIYYGEAIIVAQNSLYLPQTITGDDLSTADKAFIEKRTYRLSDKMNVTVNLTAVYESNVFVVTYYGCQVNTYDMTNIILPNNETTKSLIPVESDTYFLNNKENKCYCYNSNAHYDIDVKPYGLGLYTHNNGSGGLKYGNVSTFNKFYFMLINATDVLPNTILTWEADYNYYI